YVYSIDAGYAAAISLEYGIDVTNNIYTDYQVFYNKPEEKKNTSLSAIKNIYTSVLRETEFSKYAGYVTGLTNVFQQAPNDKDYILSQYNFLYGDGIATEANEIMIVVNSDQELTDLLLAQLGYYTQDQFINTTFRHTNDPKYDATIDKNRFDFSELIGKKFYYYPNDLIYEKQAETPFTGPFKYHHEMEKEKGQELVVKAILRPKASISYGCMTSGFFYTEAFAKKFIQDGLNSEVVKYLKDNDLSYFGMLSKENGQIDNKAITYSYNYTPSGSQDAKTTIGYVGTANAMSELLSMMMGGSSSGSSAQMTAMYTTLSLRQLGGIDVANDISIYPINFDLKDGVTKHLDAWNSDDTLTFKNSKGETITLTKDDREQITYTDNIAVMINMINSLINLITTALIAFTALSLVVSCFMIAIITYVSVVERVKEIGVIRSLGGRKKDVTHLFNAETFIIGLASGIFGILVTYLISLILNIIVENLTGVTPIAALPIWQAGVMILVSILLTVVSGLIPARSAAKKDPVVALRTE
ncbi:MAG: ABC transporter permease, partial [Anaeroplasmataceae bacterium]|nr:ABC transporter permease [Anaeroplasmataceae bacterium]